MPLPRSLKVTLAVAASLGVGDLFGADVGNLNGTSIDSTFTTATDSFITDISPFGWTELTGNSAVYGQTGGTTNDVLIGASDFANYSVQYDTNATLLTNSIYTLSFRVGFLSSGTSGTAEYTAGFGTSPDGITFNPITASSGLSTATIDRSSGPTSGLSMGLNLSNSVLVSLTYQTGGTVSGDDIFIRWAQSASSNTASSDFFGVDHVTLSVAPIPEPLAYPAMIGGLALAAAFIRRRVVQQRA